MTDSSLKEFLKAYAEELAASGWFNIKGNQSMPRGGARPGAGRKPGSRNRRTEEQARAVEESGLTPLEYLTSVYQDIGNSPDMRLDAAKAAAPYVHAKLASVGMELSGKDGGPLLIQNILEEIDGRSRGLSGSENEVG